MSGLLHVFQFFNYFSCAETLALKFTLLCGSFFLFQFDLFLSITSAEAAASAPAVTVAVTAFVTMAFKPECVVLVLLRWSLRLGECVIGISTSLQLFAKSGSLLAQNFQTTKHLRGRSHFPTLSIHSAGGFLVGDS